MSLSERIEVRRKRKRELQAGGSASVQGYVRVHLDELCASKGDLTWEDLADLLGEEGVSWRGGSRVTGKDLRSIVCRLRQSQSMKAAASAPPAMPAPSHISIPSVPPIPSALPASPALPVPPAVSDMSVVRSENQERGERGRPAMPAMEDAEKPDSNRREEGRFEDEGLPPEGFETWIGPPPSKGGEPPSSSGIQRQPPSRPKHDRARILEEMRRSSKERS